MNRVQDTNLLVFLNCMVRKSQGLNSVENENDKREGRKGTLRKIKAKK